MDSITSSPRVLTDAEKEKTADYMKLLEELAALGLTKERVRQCIDEMEQVDGDANSNEKLATIMLKYDFMEAHINPKDVAANMGKVKLTPAGTIFAKLTLLANHLPHGAANAILRT